MFDNAFNLAPVEKRLFFRAIPKHHPDILNETEDLLIAYRNLGGHLHRQKFEVIKAGTLRADYRNIGDKKPRFREKGVDVSLAINMLSLTCDKVLKEAYLVASDSDYQPAVAEIKKRGVKITYVGFAINPNLGLIAKTHNRIIISDADVLRFG